MKNAYMRGDKKNSSKKSCILFESNIFENRFRSSKIIITTQRRKTFIVCSFYDFYVLGVEEIVKVGNLLSKALGNQI